MFFISKQVDYATQFLVALALQPQDDFLSLKEFSKQHNISFLFLQKIVRLLKKAEFIEANKGAHGGYRLKIAPEKITLRTVVEAVEGKYTAVSCLKETHACPITEMCLSKNFLFQVQRDILETLEKYSLEKMSHS